jgi:hypothetical protein
MNSLFPARGSLRMNMANCAEIICGGSLYCFAEAGKDKDSGNKTGKKQQPGFPLHITRIWDVKIIKKEFATSTAGIWARPALQVALSAPFC